MINPSATQTQASGTVAPAVGAASNSGINFDNPKVIKQPSHSSGDQFAILALLKAKPHTAVVIEPKGDNKEGVMKAAQQIKDYYTSSGVDDKRIHLPKESATDPDKLVAADAKQILSELSTNSGLPVKNKSDIMSVEAGTKFVAQEWGEDARSKFREGLGLGEARTPERNQAMDDWLASKVVSPDGDMSSATEGKPETGLPLQDGDKVVVLWSRFTGKNRDNHIEHDTSNQGIKQLIEAAQKEGYKVILAGDQMPADKKTEGKPDKISDIAKKASENGKTIIDLREFWTDKGSDPKLDAWEGGERKNQLHIFDRIAEITGESPKHLGMRSGNLEALALMGQNVRYMEERGNQQQLPTGDSENVTQMMGADRMEAWHSGDNGKTQAGGEAPGYERIQLDAPPTLSGKAMQLAKEVAIHVNTLAASDRIAELEQNISELTKKAQANDTPPDDRKTAKNDLKQAKEELRNLQDFTKKLPTTRDSEYFDKDLFKPTEDPNKMKGFSESDLEKIGEFLSEPGIPHIASQNPPAALNATDPTKASNDPNIGIGPVDNIARLAPPPSPNLVADFNSNPTANPAPSLGKDSSDMDVIKQIAQDFGISPENIAITDDPGRSSRAAYNMDSGKIEIGSGMLESMKAQRNELVNQHGEGSDQVSAFDEQVRGRIGSTLVHEASHAKQHAALDGDSGKMDSWRGTMEHAAHTQEDKAIQAWLSGAMELLQKAGMDGLDQPLMREMSDFARGFSERYGDALANEQGQIRQNGEVTSDAVFDHIAGNDGPKSNTTSNVIPFNNSSNTTAPEVSHATDQTSDSARSTSFQDSDRDFVSDRTDSTAVSDSDRQAGGAFATPTPTPSPSSGSSDRSAGSSSDSDRSRSSSSGSDRSSGGGGGKSAGADIETRIGAGDGNLTGKFGEEDPQAHAKGSVDAGPLYAEGEAAAGADAGFTNEVDEHGHTQFDASANAGAGAKGTVGFEDEHGNFAKAEGQASVSAGAMASSTRNAETGIRDTTAGAGANASATATVSAGNEDAQVSATAGAEAEATAEGGVRTSDSGIPMGGHVKAGAEVGVDVEGTASTESEMGSAEASGSVGVGVGASVEGELGMNDEGEFVIGGNIELGLGLKLGLGGKVKIDVAEMAEKIDQAVDLADQALDMAEDIPVFGDVLDVARDFGGGFLDAGEEILDGDFKGAAEDLANATLKAANKAKDKVEDAAEDVGKAVEKGAKEVGKGIEKGAKEVGKAAGKAVDKAKDVAEDVGEGIKDGVEAVGGAAKDALDAITPW